MGLVACFVARELAVLHRQNIIRAIPIGGVTNSAADAHGGIAGKGTCGQGQISCPDAAAISPGVVIAELRICEGHRSPVLIQAAAVPECGIPVKQHTAGKVDCRGGIRVQATAIAALGSVIGKGKVRHGRVCPVGEKRAAGIAPRCVPIKGAIRHG